MKRSTNLYERIPAFGLAFVLTVFAFISVPVSACTIFVLTDGSRVLFCNNEDWWNPKTRIWFVPAGDGYYGCAYVGYDDGWARGGMNTEGLSCDWVGGFMERWAADSRTCVRGNPTQRMLESCATVEEAIAFFQSHQEPDFCRAKILVADMTGASAIIGAKDGKLQVEKSDRNQGFGYAYQTLSGWLAKAPEPTVDNGAAILHACLQEGKYATKYSNVFDLKSRYIYLYQFYERNDSVKLNLAVELKKGGHYYDMPQIRQQLPQATLPLLINMRRLFLDEFPPIRDAEPNVTKHISAVIQDAMGGKMRPEDYTAELWEGLSPSQKDMQADLQRYGGFLSATLVDRMKEDSGRTLRYRIEFEKVTVLMRYVLDEQNKVALMQSEGVERKPGADLGE